MLQACLLEEKPPHLIPPSSAAEERPAAGDRDSASDADARTAMQRRDEEDDDFDDVEMVGGGGSESVDDAAGDEHEGDKEEPLMPMPIQRSNTLHLSVGAPSDDDDDDDDEEDEQAQLRAAAFSWHQNATQSRHSTTSSSFMMAPPLAPLAPHSGRSPCSLSPLARSPARTSDAMIFPLPTEDAPFVVPAGMVEDEHFASALHDILHSGERLFQPIPDHNFVEEVWAKKEPKIINGYLFGGLIGEGSYAKVKEVVEEQTLVRRAVKIIKDTRLRKIPNGRENVERELKILKRVKHVNAIRLIETFRDEKRCKLYLILEYCVASIQQMLDATDTKRMGQAEAQLYFGQLITGLNYLHSVGVVHKDIKPGNLLLTRDRVLKISDFGVAEQLSPFQADDRIDNAQGTPKFQPPEAVSGSCSAYGGFAADVWACGVTLYNMLSSLYPFEGAVIMKLYDAIVAQPLEMPTNVQLEDDLKDLLTGMLIKDPLERWTIARIEECDWMMRTYEEPINFTRFPPHLDDPPHRPLTVVSALEAMYLREEECDRNGVPLESVTYVNTSPGAAPPSALASTPRPPRRTRSFIPSCLRAPNLDS